MGQSTDSKPCSTNDIISGLGNLTVTDNVQDKLSSQSQCFMKWLEECLPNVEKNKEQFFKWITLTERKIVFNPIESSQDDGHHHHEKEEDDNDLYQNGYGHIVNLQSLVYFYEEIDNFEKAKSYLDEANKFISSCVAKKFIPVEYTESFNYVLINLCRFTAAKESKQQESSDGSLYFTDFQPGPCHDDVEFENLSSKGQAGVYGIKQCFFGILRSDFQLQADLLQKVIRLDPDYYEWHFCLQTILRYKRRKGMYHHYQTSDDPWDEEKNAILTANRLSPNNVRCMVGEILLLADIAKARIKSWKPITYGHQKFSTMHALVTFINQQIQEILKTCPTSVLINTTICEILTVLLPYNYRGPRKFDIGETCLKRCLKYHPFSSKAHHRLGVLYLTKKNFDSALLHFKKAVEYGTEEGNFSSIACLIQVLIRDATTNKNELMGILSKEIQNTNSWNETQLVQLLFFKALFFLKMNENKEAMDAFIEFYERNKDLTLFEDLPYQIKRYGWDNLWHDGSDLSLSSIGGAVDESLKGEKDSSRKKLLEMCLKDIGSAIRKGRDYQRSRRRR